MHPKTHSCFNQGTAVRGHGRPHGHQDAHGGTPLGSPQCHPNPHQQQRTARRGLGLTATVTPRGAGWVPNPSTYRHSLQWLWGVAHRGQDQAEGRAGFPSLAAPRAP